MKAIVAEHVTLDRLRNARLCQLIRNGVDLLYAASDGTILAIESNTARLSDPSTIEGALELVGAVPATTTVARGPVAVIDAFVARLPPTWSRTFEGHEMAYTDRPDLRAVAGEMRCSTELATPFETWRDAFIAEAFPTGGTPPAVTREQLFIWIDGEPRAMAALLPLGPGDARIVTVYTPPASRGRGYATVLVAALAERARCTVTLDVEVFNRSAFRAYERAGFRTVGRNAIWAKV